MENPLSYYSNESYMTFHEIMHGLFSMQTFYCMKASVDKTECYPLFLQQTSYREMIFIAHYYKMSYNVI